MFIRIFTSILLFSIIVGCKSKGYQLKKNLNLSNKEIVSLRNDELIDTIYYSMNEITSEKLNHRLKDYLSHKIDKKTFLYSLQFEKYFDNDFEIKVIPENDSTINRNNLPKFDNVEQFQEYVEKQDSIMLENLGNVFKNNNFKDSLQVNSQEKITDDNLDFYLIEEKSDQEDVDFIKACIEVSPDLSIFLMNHKNSTKYFANIIRNEKIEENEGKLWAFQLIIESLYQMDMERKIPTIKTDSIDDFNF